MHTGHPARAVVVPRSAGSETNGEKQVTNVRGQQSVGASAQDPSLPLPWIQNPFCLGMGLTFLPMVPDTRLSQEPPSPHTTMPSGHCCLTQCWIKASEYDSFLGNFFFFNFKKISTVGKSSIAQLNPRYLIRSFNKNQLIPSLVSALPPSTSSPPVLFCLEFQIPKVLLSGTRRCGRQKTGISCSHVSITLRKPI